MPNYRRSKIGRIYDFELNSKAKKIIETLENYPLQSTGNDVIPIHHENIIRQGKLVSRIDSAPEDFIEDRRVVEEKVGCRKKITSYVIRHAFATNLTDKKGGCCNH